MDSIEVDDKEEKYFPISENLELIYKDTLFHLLSPEGYITFKEIEEFSASEETIFIFQNGEQIFITKEEFDMIVQAVKLCKE